MTFPSNQPTHATPGQSGPPTDPWSADALTMSYARSGDTHTMPAPPAAPTRRRRTPLLVGIGLVVALLAGIGAYAVASLWYGWSITEPERAMPSDTALFARLDLSPGLGQRLALGRVAQKFPHDNDGRDISEQLKREFLGVDDATYRRDIQPWLGERVAAGSWSADGTAAAACTVAALAVDDEGTAESSLKRVQTEQSAAKFGYAFYNGYALVTRCERTDSQAAATVARDRATAQSLAQLPAFGHALGELPGRPAAIVWADLATLRAIQDGNGPLVIGGITVPDAARTGQLVAGLEALDHGLDLNVRISGAGAPKATVDTLALLGEQPGNTAIGISSDLAASPIVNQIGQSLASSLANGPYASLATGLVQALGSVITVAVIPPATAGGAAPWRLTAEASSREKAIALAVAFGLPGLLAGISVTTDGTTMTATSRGYQGGGGRLADAEAFRKAMGTISARPAVAAYVDVAALLPTMRLTPQEAANLKPIQAAGLVVGDDGKGDVAALLRVLVP